MNAIALELRQMADRLRQLFPESDHIELHAKTFQDGECFVQEVDLHRVGDYSAATTIFRRLGIGERTKVPFARGDGVDHDWYAMRGQLEDVGFRMFGTGLPPSCHIETVTKTVPETVPTGRMVEVQERVVKCGNAEATV